MTMELHMLFITGPKFDHCLALSVAHSEALLNFVQIVEFVKVGTWICQNWYMDFSLFAKQN